VESGQAAVWTTYAIFQWQDNHLRISIIGLVVLCREFAEIDGNEFFRGHYELHAIAVEQLVELREKVLHVREEYVVVR
jgi:hypothetical protein